MNILLFGPAPTLENPTIGTFISQRVFELQKFGHKVIIVQHGNLYINNPFNTHKKGIIKIIAIIYRCFQNIFTKNILKEFTNENGSYNYYDSITFSSLKKFYKWYKKNNFNFIHAHFLWFSNWLPELKEKFSIPYIITVHGSDMHELTPYDRSDVLKVLNIMKNANKVIFVSNFLLQHAISLGYKNKNSIIIYNGVNKKIFYYDKQIKKNNNEILLGFIGHPIFIKRAFILPLVLKLVKEQIPNAKLLMLGSQSGDLLPFIKLQTWKLGLINDIEFVPSISPEKVGDYMRKLNVLLLPSYNEGFGCVVKEAQSCGIGVIGSSNGGIPEAIGKYGICVPESENFIKDYVNAIIQWIKKNHNPELIANSTKDYSWENCVKKEISIYNSINTEK